MKRFLIKLASARSWALLIYHLRVLIDYSSEQIIESFWLNIWTGASRYVRLREDAVIQDIFGFKSMPSQSTYSRFFGKFNQARNHAVFPKLQQWFFDQMNIGPVTVDFDSTVITREGRQQGAALGL